MHIDICQLLVQAKLFAELQGRTEPTCHDVASALIELGKLRLTVYRMLLACLVDLLASLTYRNLS